LTHPGSLSCRFETWLAGGADSGFRVAEGGGRADLKALEIATDVANSIVLVLVLVS
jgi:hypothetical protein